MSAVYSVQGPDPGYYGGDEVPIVEIGAHVYD